MKYWEITSVNDQRRFPKITIQVIPFYTPLLTVFNHST